MFKLRPKSKLKTSYGLLKCHKPSPHPMRPIVSSIGSLSSGAENYIKTILQKFDKGRFSLQSTLQFTNFVKENSTNFDYITSFDVESLYPKVNLDLKLKHIVDKVYSDPSYFFAEEKMMRV